jgi:adenine-specific DNA methylase
VLDKAAGKWTVRIREVGSAAGQLRQPPQPTYARGRGISLFSGAVIPEDYIKAMAQQGRLGSVLYAVAVKATDRLDFRPPEESDLQALAAAEAELARRRPQWERDDIIPTEEIPPGDKTVEPLRVGHTTWASLFSPRQLLALGTLVEELRALHPEIIRTEGAELGEAVVHLLALVVDKFANWNAMLASWNAPYATMRSVFDRHDYSFKAAFAEMAPCGAGGGLAWAIDNVLEAYEKLATLPRAPRSAPVTISQGDARQLWQLDDGSVAAVVVDPPYADNVQYAELADFFYVWLKRTQGHRRPEWFSTALCPRDAEAVLNISRHRRAHMRAGEAREAAQRFYQEMMRDVFREAQRVLRADGILTVMFTHKQQSAWAALFESLIAAGFTITATWPVQTESQHSLHQANKNAAQSTVLLACRKRPAGAGLRYFDAAMQEEIRQAAQRTAARLRDEGMNAVDQLVGSFGAAMEVFSRYDQVRTDTGALVGVADAIQLAADAVADWRVAQLAQRGLEGVDAESRFVLLCWDVLAAAEFRFNEAMLLGRSVGMDVEQLVRAGLVEKVGDRVRLLAAAERRRERPQTGMAVPTAVPLSIGADMSTGRRGRASRRQVHPQDSTFASAIDMCHALALCYLDAGGGQAGVGAAKSMALQQGWTAESPCARLMEALVRAAPEGVRFPDNPGKGKQKSAAEQFPEFRAWHALLQPLFGIQPPEWKPAAILQPMLSPFEEEEETEEFDE